MEGEREVGREGEGGRGREGGREGGRELIMLVSHLRHNFVCVCHSMYV